jgi:uncharacterized protein
MIGSLCQTCGGVAYPRRQSCPCCQGTDITDTQLSGKGDVYSYTSVREAPGAPQSPHALVHLSEGAYVMARLVEIDPVRIFIGMPVEVVGDGDSPVFRPRRNLVE